jgi:hypothetical protein
MSKIHALAIAALLVLAAGAPIASAQVATAKVTLALTLSTQEDDGDNSKIVAVRIATKDLLALAAADEGVEGKPTLVAIRTIADEDPELLTGQLQLMVGKVLEGDPFTLATALVDFPVGAESEESTRNRADEETARSRVAVQGIGLTYTTGSGGFNGSAVSVQRSTIKRRASDDAFLFASRSEELRGELTYTPFDDLVVRQGILTGKVTAAAEKELVEP